MWIIIGLIIAGLLLLVTEIVFLPGITVAGVCSLAAFVGAGYLGFSQYGQTGGFIIVGISTVLALTALSLSLRAKTWRKLSLNDELDSTSRPTPEEENVQVGNHGTTVGRLAPMGKVRIAGQLFEAKSEDAYIDPNTEVEVTGIENFNIIVKTINK